MPKGVYQRESQATISEPENAPDFPPYEATEADLPNLIVPTRLTPTIDLSKPEDSPDLPDGDWSQRHLAQFLARQPRSLVFIPKEGWEEKGVDTYQAVGYMGSRFRVLKGKPVSVPIQIAAVIEQSQEEFNTQQSQLRRRQITDIRDLPADARSRGVPGVDVSNQLGV